LFPDGRREKGHEEDPRQRVERRADVHVVQRLPHRRHHPHGLPPRLLPGLHLEILRELQGGLSVLQHGLQEEEPGHLQGRPPDTIHRVQDGPGALLQRDAAARRLLQEHGGESQQLLQRRQRPGEGARHDQRPGLFGKDTCFFSQNLTKQMGPRRFLWCTTRGNSGTATVSVVSYFAVIIFYD
jgi:hypothetical protein